MTANQDEIEIRPTTFWKVSVVGMGRGFWDEIQSRATEDGHHWLARMAGGLGASCEERPPLKAVC